MQTCLCRDNIHIVCRDNSKYHKKEKYKRDMQIPGFLGEKKTSMTKEFAFFKTCLFLF